MPTEQQNKQQDKELEHKEPKPHRRWTAANIVTVIRIFLIPVWYAVAMMNPISVQGEFSPSLLGVAIFYIVLALTDKLDGYLARSRNEVTTFGKFLDPIADKLVVVFALVFLLQINLTDALLLLIVIAREFLVAGLRMVTASKGVVVAASNLGKAKTFTTMAGISGMLLVRCLPPEVGLTVVLPLSLTLLIVAMILTLWSGIDYFVKCWKYLAN